MNKPLWQPSAERVANANLTAFARKIRDEHGVDLPDYPAILRWSVTEIEKFWQAVWEFCDIIGEGGGPVLADPDKMPGARFFPERRINFAENLLRGSGSGTAIAFWGEDKVKRRMSFDELRALVSRLQQVLVDQGVGPGDRVAGFMPNMPEAVAAMLATASLGAVWSSCSPDFGVQGVLDRFGQIEPKVLFCPDGYFYNGKALDSLGRVAEFSAQLPTVKQIIVCPYLSAEPDVSALPKGVRLADAIAGKAARQVAYRRMPFNSPLYIMFSSGTTGKPKCIVHGAGGTLLTHLKEHILLCDVKPGDRVFYFTTCGWMMWNWVVSCLGAGATLVQFDGSPFAPRPEILWDLADAEKVTLFGTSAKYIDALKNFGCKPRETHDLSTVRLITSTGSPLVAESFDYVYAQVKKDVCLSSISGGTDIIACFVGGNPIGPVWRGEIQARCLGMAVEVLDDDGRPVQGQKGELVCKRPFPSMPLGFWDDPGDERYRAAYFERYDNTWCQGDFAEITAHEGMIIYGRSDATLNPGGVRIGTAEIYRQVEQLPEVEEALVIGQDWEGDVRVVLFVRLAAGAALDGELVKRIKTQIRTGASPRHVPAKVIQVADIPRTKSGKIVELAVRDVVHGRAVKNKEALANPEALELYRGLPELEV